VTVLLLDCHSLLYRAYHALPPMTTAGGLPSQALYGFTQLLLKLLREEAPSHVVFARDLPGPTFRHARYPGYKAGRAPTPAALRSQLDALSELSDAFGVSPACAAGFEADDVLATCARALGERSESQLVVTGDRDLLQLIGPHTAVLFAGARGKPPTRYDGPAFRARFGFSPERLPLYSALLGEGADNLPKVPGIGEATARRLVAAHADAAALLADTDALKGGQLRDTLTLYAEQVRTTEDLARLEQQVPLDLDAVLGAVEVGAFTRLLALCSRWEFRSLVARVEALLTGS
jgi:DNA polymerase I